MSPELEDLAADIREHVLYLRELGVENLAVDLPPVREAAAPESKRDAPAAAEAFARFIPDKRIGVKPPPARPGTRAPAPRLGLLESMKLSNVKTQPRRDGTSVVAPVKHELPSPEPISVEMVSGPQPPTGDTIESIRADIGDCRRCGLCAGRTNIANSTGNFAADLMFVGEAPGADEDMQGAPFVGRAGQLLTKIIEAIGMKREDVFIGNINRCRPPANRAPLPDETAACKPFLLREIAVVKPKVIVVLGNTAMKNLLDTREGITKIRGVFQDYLGVKVMPTFHPAYLLRDPSKKREVWEDMKKVRDYLNENR